MDDRVGAVQLKEGGQEASTVVMLSVIGKFMRWWTRRRQEREAQSDGLFLAWVVWLVLSLGRKMLCKRTVLGSVSVTARRCRKDVLKVCDGLSSKFRVRSSQGGSNLESLGGQRFVWFWGKIIKKKRVRGQKQSRPGMLAGQGERKRGYRRCGRTSREQAMLKM